MEERQRKGRKVWRKRKNKGGRKERSMRKRSEGLWNEEEEEDRRRRRGS